jgi:DNA (cytosine-5)-methyltransferase 1
VLQDLPALRSRLSRSTDTASEWSREVRCHFDELAKDASKNKLNLLSDELSRAAEKVLPGMSPGALRYPRVARRSLKPYCSEWYLDPKLDVWLNHESRAHMTSDLRRYGYAAAYAAVNELSPKGEAGFSLSGLAPNHGNWASGKFADRFRVQRYGAPSSTITSHISKDGNYFIHPDAAQCRTLTVREAARLQTFPDNYFFQGNRTEQYHQVGNAVPPKLALLIADVVREILS